MRAGDRLQRLDRIVAAGDMRRVAARPYHDEIVPRDLPAIDAVAGGDEFLFRLRVMHENQVCVVTRGRLKRLPGSLSQNMHGYAGFLGKGRQDVRQQARIFD